MKNINIIEYPGVDHIQNNFETYRELFLNDATMAFRNANCNREEQQRVMEIFGDNLGWWPNSERSGSAANYEETHERHMDADKRADKDSFMLGWHLEHVQLQNNVYVGSSWCMNLFQCDPDAGKTYFVDMIAIYDSLSDEYKEFLDGTEALLKTYWGPHDKDPDSAPAIYTLVQEHWILKKKVLRLFLASIDSVELYKIHGNDPTEQEKLKFKEILIHIHYEIKDNLDNRMVHLWQEGDMVISDMFRMAHAVTGGFAEGERRLDGIFGRRLPE
jgi:alpha-ketoglutarate-dependent taurine dioxygenase